MSVGYLRKFNVSKCLVETLLYIVISFYEYCTCYNLLFSSYVLWNTHIILLIHFRSYIISDLPILVSTTIPMTPHPSHWKRFLKWTIFLYERGDREGDHDVDTCPLVLQMTQKNRVQRSGVWNRGVVSLDYVVLDPGVTVLAETLPPRPPPFRGYHRQSSSSSVSSKFRVRLVISNSSTPVSIPPSGRNWLLWDRRGPIWPSLDTLVGNRHTRWGLPRTTVRWRTRVCHLEETWRIPSPREPSGIDLRLPYRKYRYLCFVVQ